LKASNRWTWAWSQRRSTTPDTSYRNGTWEPDPLILDDQALIINVAGKGLVVLTGCGHAGIVNICRYACRLTGVDCLHLVMGDFISTALSSSPSSMTSAMP
jgi:7,8-dihydropterin-6-yl-methyl-4-(beta-D-ribofuranosyl)aminobenzene 5'-phosphate synthase